MKRCPQCEFIYEDDQSLCDMDGVLLVMDARTFPNFQALTTVPAKAPPKRVRAVPAFATIILAGVLGMVYYVSTQRHTDADSLIPPQPIAASLVNPVPTIKPLSEPILPVEEESSSPTATKAARAAEISAPVKKTTTKTAVTAPSVSAPSASTRTVKPSTEPRKEESKVGSILKKTGRILKKPFKF
jgi:hypothetical protein